MREQRGMQAQDVDKTEQELEREDARTEAYIRWAFIVVLALVAGVGGWAGVTRIGGAVVATGKVAVEANTKSIQHLEGGIVTKLAVREGQEVSKGELLVQLDPGQTDEKLRGLESQARAKKDQLELLRSELDDLESLAAKRLLPRSQLAKAQRDFAELEGETGRLAAELARFTANRARLDVRAPIAGRIHGLKVHTVGGVIKPGQEITRIVPSGAPLIIEGAVRPADIDQVTRGQSVAIRLTSFNQRTTPEVNGRVTNVSADLVSDERDQTVTYVVHITFEEGEIARLGKRLVPGMPADVFIRTEERTVMNYLLAPLTDQFNRALREE